MLRRCTVCVLPESFPGISFSDDGVCSVCRELATQPAPGRPAEELLGEMERVIEEARSARRQYDAVVAFSGGKDSTFLIHLLQERYDLRLLALTLDNGFLSRTCFDNIATVVSALHVDHMTIRYRADHLNAIFLESGMEKVYPDHLTMFGSGVCISCIRMVMTAVLRTAIEKRVPLVMLGNSPGQLLRSNEELIYRDNKIPFALRRRLFDRLAERTGSWLYDYVTLTEAEHRTHPFPYTISPLPIVGYDEAEIYRTISGLGWSRPTDVDPNSTNCRLNAFGIVRHVNRYRFHPYDYEMAQLVRLGAMTREAALEKLGDATGSVGEVAAQVEKSLFCGPCGRQCGGG